MKLSRKILSISTWLLLISFILSGPALHAQSRKDLEKKRKKNQEQIKYTNKLLEQTQRDKKISMNQLVILDKKINIRQDLIKDINKEIDVLSEKIKENQEIITSLQSDLTAAKLSYKKMLVFAYKNRNGYDQLMFILSASDFNQAYRRLKYLQHYAEYREKQIAAIKALRDIINDQLRELEQKRDDKESLLKEEQTETQQLSKEKTQKTNLVGQLQNKEKDLKKKLQEQKLADQKLQKAISDIIAEEIRKAEEEKKKQANTGKKPDPKNLFNLTPEELLISDNFGANMGRLPWPVERGVITGTYGEHEHPVLKGIMVKNDGIYISTTQGSKARAVFEGTVSKIISIPGKNKAVIVRHGNYLSVYSNLSEVVVKSGDKLKSKQDIGVIYTDESEGNKTILELQIWEGTKKLNPQLWLSKGQ